MFELRAAILVLSMSRPSDVRHMKRTEVDFSKRLWKTLGERMKMRRPHDAPLSRQAIRFYFKTKRKRYLDSQNEFVLDALSGTVYQDDNQIAALYLFRDYDAANPRNEITIGGCTVH